MAFAPKTHISDKKFLMLTNSDCLFGLTMGKGDRAKHSPTVSAFSFPELQDEYAFFW